MRKRITKIVRSNIFEFILNLLAGVAWFLAFTGAFFAFKYTVSFGYVVGFSAGFLGVIPGLLMVVFLESISMQLAIRKEQKRQSDLINEILETIKPNKDQ